MTWFDRIIEARVGDEEKAQLLKSTVFRGASLDEPSEDLPMLRTAILLKLRSCAFQLIELGVGPEDDRGETDSSLHYAAANDDVDLLRVLLTSGWQSLMHRPEMPLNMSPLGEAVSCRCYHAMGAFLDAGAAIDHEWNEDWDGGYRDSALSIAARNGDIFYLRHLMAAGADPRFCGFMGSTSMSAALRNPDRALADQMARIMRDKHP